MMNPEELARYHRQIIFAPVGEEGQQRLRAATAVVVGCGATGSALSNLLVRAGVGWVRIVDRDFIELNNIQRQILLDEEASTCNAAVPSPGASWPATTGT